MSMAGAVLVNGVPGDTVSVRDRGLQYGDGLFETVCCEQGSVRWFARHLRRLDQGCERLGIKKPDGNLLRAEAQRLSAGMPRAIVKIIVTRGEAVARGYAPRGDELPTRIVSVYSWPTPGHTEFRVGLSPVQLGCNPRLAGCKHLNRLEQVLAQLAATSAGLQEVLMRSSAGDVVCGSTSNLFALHEAQWLTPAVTQCGVAGIMRSLVLDNARQLGLQVKIAALSPEMLSAASSMFVTNVRLGVQAVHCYEGRRLKVDECGARLQELIDGTLD